MSILDYLLVKSFLFKTYAYMDFFILNPRYFLVKNKQNTHNYLLHDSKNNEYFTLNEAIFNFLKLFRKPTVLSRVVATVSKREGEPKEAIAPILDIFLKDMLAKEIVIRSEVEHINVKTSTDNEHSILINIEGYEVEKQLAESFPIFVYQCKEKESKEKVIVKILDQENSKGKKKLDVFLHEFKILAKLNHPNIISLIEVKKNYGILEYFEGKSMPDIVKKPIDMASRVAIINQLLSGLAHLHNKNIIHGDLHPDNILINKQNKLKIIDFDLACSIRSKTARYGGIREFLAPELIVDDMIEFIGKRPTKRSEVYQIGILIYYTLYAKFPVDKTTWKEHISAVKNNEIDFFQTNQFGQIIENQYLKLVKRCLALNPIDRFASATKILKEIKNIVSVSNI